MEVIISCLHGIEDVCIKEAKELTKGKAVKLSNNRIKLTCKDAEVLKNNLRSGSRIFKLIGELTFKSIEDIAKAVADDFEKFEEPIAVRCSRQGLQKFHSNDAERIVGEALHFKRLSVNLKNPKTKIIVDVSDNKCYYGILIAEDLNKREYRIKSTSQSINSTICYALVRLSGYKKGKILLDPFSKDGTIIIEAAAFSHSLPLKFNKPVDTKEQNIFCSDPLLANVNNSETNSKLAGVNKAIKFSRYDIEWLDTKFSKSEINYIVTVLPYHAGDRQKDAEKEYKELFYQAEFILSKTGRMVLLSHADLKSFLGKFKIVSETEIISGDIKYRAYVLSKK